MATETLVGDIELNICIFWVHKCEYQVYLTLGININIILDYLYIRVGKNRGKNGFRLYFKDINYKNFIEGPL